ncbi:phage late control D family protein [Paenibacillus bouchesdurhonensis]|uniref:phage late control D family protein n=1 Tax=Paenibacillus bouchesdurhonensis TaxID=1870990 RepID=UPI000DA60EF4|nr:contractile injection system protein, VgrG/Pvc8 family [Paenibacillus bouchesdurhonensis]
MDKIQDARRVVLVINYNGKDVTQDLADSLLDFAYNDADPGAMDDIQITLEDRERKWQEPWQPAAGDKIKAELRTINWGGPGEIKSLPLGSFEVDSLEFAGPPDTVAIKAVSLPVGSSARQEVRTKAWEKVKLKTIAQDVAKRAGLKLLYEATDNPSYDRLDQTEQSDLAFLNDQAKQEGIAVKIASGKLVLFDESEYEKKEAVATIEHGKDNILSYQFSWGTAYTAYRACQVTYKPPKSKKTIKYTYTPPGAPKSGPVLKINQKVSSAAEAQRLAKKSIREKNKEAGKASLTLVGDIRMAAGLTLNVKGWGRFDGKYIIESCSHAISGSGYLTNLEIRKVLGW